MRKKTTKTGELSSCFGVGCWIAGAKQRWSKMVEGEGAEV